MTMTDEENRARKGTRGKSNTLRNEGRKASNQNSRSPNKKSTLRFRSIKKTQGDEPADGKLRETASVNYMEQEVKRDVEPVRAARGVIVRRDGENRHPKISNLNAANNTKHTLRRQQAGKETPIEVEDMETFLNNIGLTDRRRSDFKKVSPRTSESIASNKQDVKATKNKMKSLALFYTGKITMNLKEIARLSKQNLPINLPTAFFAKLKGSLKSEPLLFLQSYVSVDGLAILIQYIEQISELRATDMPKVSSHNFEQCGITILECIKVIIAEESGLESLFEIDHGLDIIYELAAHNHLNVCSAVLDLFTNLCLTPKGHFLVLNATKNSEWLGHQPIPHFRLMSILYYAMGKSDTTVITSALTFVNAILQYFDINRDNVHTNNYKNLFARMHLRCQFIASGLTKMFAYFESLKTASIEENIDLFYKLQTDDYHTAWNAISAQGTTWEGFLMLESIASDIMCAGSYQEILEHLCMITENKKAHSHNHFWENRNTQFGDCLLDNIIALIPPYFTGLDAIRGKAKASAQSKTRTSAAETRIVRSGVVVIRRRHKIRVKRKVHRQGTTSGRSSISRNSETYDATYTYEETSAAVLESSADAPAAPPPPPAVPVPPQMLRLLPEPPDKYRMVNIRPLPKAAVANTIWDRFSYTEIFTKLKVDTLKDHFAVAATTAKVLKTGSGKPKNETIIDARIVQGIMIFLRTNHLEVSGLMETLRDIKNVDEISELYLRELMHHYKLASPNFKLLLSADVETITNDADLLMYHMAKIPNAPERLKMLYYQKTFNEIFEDLSSKVQVFIKACEQISKSKHIEVVLGIILTLANYMNKGPLATATGIELQSLNQVIEHRSVADNSINLLTFAMLQVETQFPEAYNVDEELEALVECSIYSYDEILSTYNQLRGNVKEFTISNKDLEQDTSFAAFYNQVMSETNPLLNFLRDTFRVLAENVGKCLQLFGVNLISMRIPEFFAFLGNFVKQIKISKDVIKNKNLVSQYQLGFK